MPPLFFVYPELYLCFGSKYERTGRKIFTKCMFLVVHLNILNSNIFTLYSTLLKTTRNEIVVGFVRCSRSGTGFIS